MTALSGEDEEGAGPLFEFSEREPFREVAKNRADTMELLYIASCEHPRERDPQGVEQIRETSAYRLPRRVLDEAVDPSARIPEPVDREKLIDPLDLLAIHPRLEEELESMDYVRREIARGDEDLLRAWGRESAVLHEDHVVDGSFCRVRDRAGDIDGAYCRPQEALLLECVYERDEERTREIDDLGALPVSLQPLAKQLFLFGHQTVPSFSPDEDRQKEAMMSTFYEFVKPSAVLSAHPQASLRPRIQLSRPLGGRGRDV